MSITETHSAIRTRMLFFYGVVVAVVISLFCGLAYRQLFSNDAFARDERRQNHRRILLPGPRGEIFDREGRILVANRARFAVVLFLSDARVREQFRTEYRDIRDDPNNRLPKGEWEARARVNVVQRYLDQCNQILRRQEAVTSVAVEKQFFNQPLLPFTILDDLGPNEFAALLEQLPPSSPLQMHSTTTRHYPFGRSAAHTLGYVSPTEDLVAENLPGEELTTFTTTGSRGRSGLERRYDAQLQGKPGSEIWVVDPVGYQVRMVDNVPPVSGQPLHTSLDIDLQLAGENAFGDKEGALVALDVRSGEVLALVSKPDYDLNDTTPRISTATWKDMNDRGALYSRATQGVYPPGSTFKIIAAIAGLRSGAITPETEYSCNGVFLVGRAEFPCHGRHAHGRMTLVPALRASCNIYFYQEGLATGIDGLAAEARRFGLDRPTGIEVAEETRMLVPDAAWKKARFFSNWTSGDTANVSIGQGALDVTPLQMACFMASFARDETTTTPTILRRPPGAGLIQANNHVIGLSPAARAAVVLGLEEAVERGTLKNARIAGIRLAGKTGTAQKDVYIEGRKRTINLAWTIIYGPVENPTIAIASMVVGDTPDEEYAGGAYAAPIARAVLETYFKKHPPVAPGPRSLFTAPR